MTMSVTIVNTSNWKGENLQVAVVKTDPSTGKKTTPHVEILKPGESMNEHGISPAGDGKMNEEIRVKAIREEKTEPLRDKSGRQVFPRVKVEME